MRWRVRVAIRTLCTHGEFIAILKSSDLTIRVAVHSIIADGIFRALELSIGALVSWEEMSERGVRREQKSFEIPLTVSRGSL